MAEAGIHRFRLFPISQWRCSLSSRNGITPCGQQRVRPSHCGQYIGDWCFAAMCEPGHKRIQMLEGKKMDLRQTLMRTKMILNRLEAGDDHWNAFARLCLSCLLPRCCFELSTGSLAIVQHLILVCQIDQPTAHSIHPR